MKKPNAWDFFVIPEKTKRVITKKKYKVWKQTTSL